MTPKFYLSLMASTAVTLLVSGVVLLIYMLSTTIGPFRFGALSEQERSRVVGVWLPEDFHVRPSPATRVRVQAWRNIIPLDRSHLESTQLSVLREEGVRLVALPDARGLSAERFRELLAFVRWGGGAILTGSVGVRDAAGGWQGYDIMRELLGVSEIQTLSAYDSAALAAWRRGPLTVGLRPGERIRLIAEPGVPTISNPRAGLSWESLDAAKHAAASMARRLGAGRLVWLAAGPESARQAGNETWRGMVRVVHDAIAWVSQDPTIEVLTWPRGAPFAGRVRTETAGGLIRDASTNLPSRREIRARLDRAEADGSLAEIRLLPRFARDDEAEALKVFAQRELGRRGAWEDVRNEAESWTGLNEKIATELRAVGPRRLLVDVTNRSDRSRTDVALRIHFNRSVRSIRVEGTTLMQGRPDLKFIPGGESVDLLLPELKKRSSRAWTIDYEPEVSTEPPRGPIPVRHIPFQVPESGDEKSG